MSAKLLAVSEHLQSVHCSLLRNSVLDRGELTVEVSSACYLELATKLRDDPELRLASLIDLCGVDYSTHALYRGTKRFAVVCHLLSVVHNFRLRLRVWIDNDEFPVVPSVCEIWPSANWFEREAFDMYGILFESHPDLRRILTDYGFIGHPFRKDFPISGYVEMRYDSEVGRVVYQPVTIEPREITPRIVREESYGEGHRG